MPGPLLAFVVLDSSRKRKITGHFVIVGHALWEALVIYLILLGLDIIIKQYEAFIYAAGGFVLILMGAFMIKSRSEEVKVEHSKVNSSILGGVFYTAFNPTQPPWWATAGLLLLLQGSELMGTVGIATVTIGHWLADLTYYTLISYMIYKYGRYINPWQRQISIILGLFIAILGLYFMIRGISLTV
ncbi:MAG: LysE family translocator [Candidatus Bathyarchaeota archaeon]|nr:LysE family translocator [Candidatus Bathyarchaeota archaeon]